MRPTLRQLQYIIAVADTGQFSEAARRCYVSQPSLSAQIAEMEGYLGVTLAERGRQGARLTPAGEELVRRARMILRDVEELTTVARQQEGTLTGRLRLGVLPSVGPYMLPQTVKLMHEHYPDFRLLLRDQATVELDTALRAGELDCIISSPADHVGMEFLQLFTEDMWICSAEDDPLGGTDAPLKPEQLKDRFLLSLGERTRLSLITQQIADLAGARVDLDYLGTSLDAIRQMSVIDAGIAILPGLYARTEAMRDPYLTLRPIDHEIASREIALIFRPGSPLQTQFELIAEELRIISRDVFKADP